MNWWVYILKSEKTGKYYIGCSNDYKRRLGEHNNGENFSTRLGCPWAVVHLEGFENQSEAFNREKKIKSYKGGNGFKKLLNL
jgi:putative endonuclease